MAALAASYRQSGADSVDDNRSRYVPSSVYSGPGTEADTQRSTLPVQPFRSIYAVNGMVNGGQSGRAGTNGFTIPYTPRARTSEALNLSDPVAMHLLTETALGDSKSFEILSFEELEQLKLERSRLRNRIQTLKRKIALETKLRDAAQSLNRLYTGAGTNGTHATGHRRNGTDSSKGSTDASYRAEDELTASQSKIQELRGHLEALQEKLDQSQRQILEHTAGVLQLTHRGLKKTVRKHELPRSPESMASPGQRGISGGPMLDDFDERSLYPVPDYVNDFIGASPMSPMMMMGQTKSVQDPRAMGVVAGKLQLLCQHLHSMAVQMQMADVIQEPPGIRDSQQSEQIDGQLSFLTQGLESLAAAQERTIQETGHVAGRINDMLEKTKSVSRSPVMVQDMPQGNDVGSQLAFSTRVLEQLHSRVETLVEQKDILTRQIQQQRELNSKSDAEKDQQLQDMTRDLTDSQQKQIAYEEESQRTRHEISQLMDQLDRARDDNQLLEKQRGMNDEKALGAEREARQRVEKDLNDQISHRDKIAEQLQTDLSKLRNDHELQSQLHTRQLKDVSYAREKAEIDAKSHQAEAEKLLEQMAGIQTELVMAKAELDGAYGSRAQRAADVSSNPAVQRQIDDLQSLNSQLQRELKDTIEDYEQMTKTSIEFEKERDGFEASIDKLRDKCESLETQLNEERLKSLGSKSAVSHDTTSTTVLKNEFKKMMRDTKNESMKAIRHEQEERRKLEAIIRQMRKETGVSTPSKSTGSNSHLSAGPGTPA